jgi:uncharacterized beta-barrel protein YwiB (DUF1934 family)
MTVDDVMIHTRQVLPSDGEKQSIEMYTLGTRWVTYLNSKSLSTPLPEIQ